jgi:tetratricopeptide (TPR) repeat protein
MRAVSEKRLREAFAALRAGELERAERLCTAILKEAPRQPRASHLLGVLYLQRGEAEAARRWLRIAAESDPDDTQALEDLGVAEWAAGGFDAAEAAFERALARGKRDASTHVWYGLALARRGEHARAASHFELAVRAEPHNPEFRINLGNALRQQGRLEEALLQYETAVHLAPEHVGALAASAAALHEAGRKDEALARYRKALAAQPRNAELLHGLGTVLQDRNEHEQAAECFRAALESEPGRVDSLTELGLACEALGRREEALACYRRALEIRPDHVDALNNLGVCHYKQLDFAASLDCLERAAALAPDCALIHHNLANTLGALGRLEEAVAAYRRALALEPENLRVLEGLGAVLIELGRLDDAETCYRRALEIAPEWAEALFGLGVLRLYTGDFARGWQGYEARFDTQPPKALRRGLALARAGLEDLASGRRIALLAEQGLGDKVLYSSLVPDLLRRGVEPIVETDARLLPIFRRSFPGVESVAKEEPPCAALHRAHAWVSAGSLPGLLRTRAEDFRAQPSRFLFEDAQKAGAFRRALEQPGRAFAVAVSWKSTHAAYGRPVQAKKSASLAAFRPLASVPGVRLVDVQYGDTDAEREAFAAATGKDVFRFREVDHFNDLEGVLAILAACDLVVTTSNVTAHFAGALGRPTWLLYLAGRAPFFYWVPGPDGRSLWYPSVEIVSGPEFTSWEALLEHVAGRLARMLGGA